MRSRAFFSEHYIIIRARVREKRRNLVTVDACITNMKGETCTQAVCTYFTFSEEKAREEMYFKGCHTEDEEVNPV